MSDLLLGAIGKCLAALCANNSSRPQRWITCDLVGTVGEGDEVAGREGTNYDPTDRGRCLS